MSSSGVSLATGSTLQLQVIGSYPNGATHDLSSVSNFVTSDARVATVDVTGKITGVGAGAATITASYLAFETSVNITVVSTAPTLQSITATPPTISFVQGATQQLQVTASLGNNTTQDVTSTATYTSSDASIATVSASGLIAAVSVGQATVTAAYQGMSTVRTITVTPAPIVVASIAVTSSTKSLPAGTKAQLTAIATYSDGTTANVTNSVAYTSSNPAVATVDANGQITAIAAGSAVITATYQGKTATINITITAATATEPPANSRP